MSERASLRRGYLLAEALCALALAGVLTVAAATVLSSARVAFTRLDERTSAERVGREALGIAVALLRAGDSLVVLGDTAVDVTLRTGIGLVCAADPIVVRLAPRVETAGGELTAWSQAPDVGDDVAFFRRDSLSATYQWIGETIDGVVQGAPTAPCDVAGGWVPPGAVHPQVTALTLRAPLDGIAAGTPVRLSRRGRVVLYVDARGEWMLGWRRCAQGTCGVVQPVAGPLRTPSAGGFRVAVSDADSVIFLSVAAVGAPEPMRMEFLRDAADR